MNDQHGNVRGGTVAACASYEYDMALQKWGGSKLEADPERLPAEFWHRSGGFALRGFSGVEPDPERLPYEFWHRSGGFTWLATQHQRKQISTPSN